MVKRLKLKGPWFKGNFAKFSIKQRFAKAPLTSGLKEPLSVETKKVGPGFKSRFYHKPIQPGERRSISSLKRSQELLLAQHPSKARRSKRLR